MWSLKKGKDLNDNSFRVCYANQLLLSICELNEDAYKSNSKYLKSVDWQNGGQGFFPSCLLTGTPVTVRMLSPQLLNTTNSFSSRRYWTAEAETNAFVDMDIRSRSGINTAYELVFISDLARKF